MMQAVPYNLQGNGVTEVAGINISQISSSISKWKSLEHQQEFATKIEFEELQVPLVISTKSGVTTPKATSSVESEPTSTLDTTQRSPSPPTSISTLSCTPDKVTGDSGLGERESGFGLEEWDNIFPNGEGALLPWIMGEADDMGQGLKHLLQSENPVDYEGNVGLGIVEQGSSLEGLSSSSSPPLPIGVIDGNNDLIGYSLGFNSASPNSTNGLIANCTNSTNKLESVPVSLQAASYGGGLGFSHPLDVGNPQFMMNPQQAQSVMNPSYFMPPFSYCQLEQNLSEPQAKRHNSGIALDSNLGQVVKNPFVEHNQAFLLRKQHQHQVHGQALKDQLFKAANLIQNGNFSLAQEILARLNHLSLPAKPHVRAALYVKEALQLLLMSNPVATPPPKTFTPYDVVHKMNAYKVFSDVSPITHFVNFTCTQAILEALNDADAIHIIDFDIGYGAQWASLIQELPMRKNGVSSLKITALSSLSTSHPFELSLVRENLMQFASDNGVAFELQVLNLDSFDQSSSIPNLKVTEDQSIAVIFPIWATSYRPSYLPSILRFIKRHSPKIIVSFDRGCDRFDVPFSQHLIHTLESNTSLLESLDGLNVASDITNKVEKFFVQPMIENIILGRVHAPDNMPHWKNLFTSCGFSPMQFSNFTETQADYVVKRTPGRGFHVEKHEASLVLNWQRRELVTTSAWKC